MTPQSADSDTEPFTASSGGRDAASRPRRRRRAGKLTRHQASLRSSNVVLGLVGATLVFSAQVVGAVHVRTMLALSPLAVLAGFLALRREGMQVLRGPGWLLIGLSAYCVVQSLPLPLGLLEHLDARSAEVWRGAARPFGGQVAWASLSLDPGASRVEALKWLACAGVFIAAASVARKRDARVILGVVFGSAVLVALVTLAHRLVGADALFGIYRPQYALPRFAMSPLLNPNNLAGYLNLGVFAGVALMVARKPVAPLWALGFCVAIVAAVSAVAGSRAGFTSLSVGALVTLAVLRFHRFEDRQLPRVVLVVPGAALLLGAVLFFLGADRSVWQALFEESAKKLSLISWTKPLVLDHFWFGVGRGAFETAFPAYRADIGPHIYQFAENFVMQWCSEWGVPLALGALGALGWFLRPARLGVGRTPTVTVAFVGIVVLLAHNLLDLGLEVLAVALACFTLLGGLWGRRMDAPEETESPRNARALAFGFALLGLVIWGLAVATGAQTALQDRQALSAAHRANTLASAAKQAQPRAAAELSAAVQSAVLRHPADPFLPLIGALAARSRGENPLPWLARAIERDPMSGRPYLVLAHVLAQRGATTQALLSLSMAVEREFGLIRKAAPLAAALTQDFGLLLGAAPEGSAGAGMLMALAAEPRLAALRLPLLEAALARDARVSKPKLLVAEYLLTAMEAERQPCASTQLAACRARVLALAREVSRLEPSSAPAIVLRARLLASEKRPVEALALLREACATLSVPADCFRWQVIIAAQARDVKSLDEAGSVFMGASCAQPASCGSAAFWLGQRYEEVQEHGKALSMFERAAHETDSAAAWQQVARISVSLGMPHAGDRAAKRARDAAASAPPPPPDSNPNPKPSALPPPPGPEASDDEDD